MADSSLLAIARGQISQELAATRREALSSRQALGGLDEAAKGLLYVMGRFGQAMNQSMLEFMHGAKRMQGDIQDLRQELNRLGTVKEKPNVEVENQASKQIMDIGQQLLGLKDRAISVLIGTDTKGVKSEMEQIAKERRLYAAKGKTDREMEQFDQHAKEVLAINPDLNRAQAMALVSTSEQLNGSEGSAYALKAAKLAYTTGQDSAELLKTMIALRDATNVKDADRISNSLQYMVTHGKDSNGDMLKDLVAYSKNTNQMLDTPEKIAAMVDEMGKIGVMSMDKGFESLKDATRQLSSKGDLEKVLQTGYEAINKNPAAAKEQAGREAREVEKLLTSGSKEEIQYAFGKLMQTFASVKDEKARSKMLDELGKSAGQDLANQFAPLLNAAGRLATGETVPHVGKNELDQSYERARKYDDSLEYRKAQNDAKQVVIDDLSPAFKFLANQAKGLSQTFSSMPDIARYGLEWVALLGPMALGVYKFYDSVSTVWRKVKALQTSKGPGVGDSDLDAGGSNGAEMDVGDGPDKKDGRKSKKGKGKRKNSPKKPPAQTGVPGNQAGRKGSGTASLLKRVYNPKALPKQRIVDSLVGGATYAERMASHSGGVLKTVARLGKGLTKRLPLIGQALQAGEILTVDNKLEAAGRVGASALGGWGGALAGAAIGSVVPVVGTALGGIIGGAIGAFGGETLFDAAKGWFSKSSTGAKRENAEAALQNKMRLNFRTANRNELTTATEADATKIAGQLVQTLPQPTPIPVASPTATKAEQPRMISLTIPSMPITIHAEGILQDEAGLLKLLSKGSVGAEIIRLVEKGMVDAMQTRGGVAGGRVGGVPV